MRDSNTATYRLSAPSLHVEANCLIKFQFGVILDEIMEVRKRIFSLNNKENQQLAAEIENEQKFHDADHPDQSGIFPLN